MADPRQVLSQFDIDVDPLQFADVVPGLVHPDTEAALAAIVESTLVEGVYELVDHFGAGAGNPPGGR